jgi:hypothetical protein
MDAPNAWSAQPVFGYERFPLPQVSQSVPATGRDLPPTSKVKRAPTFAFPAPAHVNPDQTDMGFSNTNTGTTSSRVLDAADSVLARLPGALLLAIGVFVGVAAAYGILTAVQVDRVSARTPAQVVHESPRPALLTKPILTTARATSSTHESSGSHRLAVHLPVRRPAR